MLKISIGAIEAQAHEESADISRLWNASYFEMRFLPILGRPYERCLIYLALAIVSFLLLYLLRNWTSICGNTSDLLLSCSAAVCSVLAVMVMWCPVFCELTRARIYCINPGEQFPLISHGSTRLGHHRTNIVARTTEPNVRVRLKKRFDSLLKNPKTIAVSDESSLVIDIGNLSRRCDGHNCRQTARRQLIGKITKARKYWSAAKRIILKSRKPRLKLTDGSPVGDYWSLPKQLISELKQLNAKRNGCNCLQTMSESLSPALVYGRDFWPVARLVISRLLYTPVEPSPPSKSSPSSAHQSVVLREGHHLWFAFVTHRLYIAGWLLMVAMIMLVVPCSRFYFGAPSD
jgi:hypothetical protein